MDLQTDNDLFGPTRNPLHHLYTPGGSRGDAAAVASGMTALGIGSDYGGSLRWPAQCTGLVSLRPTAELFDRDGQTPFSGDGLGLANNLSLQGQLQVIGPLARTVDDLELALRILAGSRTLDSSVTALSNGHLQRSGGPCAAVGYRGRAATRCAPTSCRPFGWRPRT